MRKKKDKILVNYEGEPFYNCSSGEWLIDFEPKIKDEFQQLIEDGDNGKIACCVMAERNMTYEVMKAFWSIDGSSKYCCLIALLGQHDIYYTQPYRQEDMHFLFYRLGQLLIKHQKDNISFLQKERGIYVASSLMEFWGIDIIEEKGDIFNYSLSSIEFFWNHFWNGHRTDFFKIDKLFKSDRMRRFVYRLVSRLHWFDGVVH